MSKKCAVHDIWLDLWTGCPECLSEYLKLPEVKLSGRMAMGYSTGSRELINKPFKERKEKIKPIKLKPIKPRKLRIICGRDTMQSLHGLRFYVHERDI